MNDWHIKTNSTCWAAFSRGGWEEYMPCDDGTDAVWEKLNFAGGYDLSARIESRQPSRYVYVEWQVAGSAAGGSWEEIIPLDVFRLHCRRREVECFVAHCLADNPPTSIRNFWELKVRELGGEMPDDDEIESWEEIPGTACGGVMIFLRQPKRKMKCRKLDTSGA